MRGFTTALTLVALLAVGAPAASAQEVEQGMEQEAMGTAAEAGAQEATSRYADSEAGWTERRFAASGFAGHLSGGTPMGSQTNLFFRTTFEQGGDRLVGFRVSYAVAPRFDVELEFGSSSPGLNAVLTDLSGQGRTDVEFADLDVRHLMAVVNYSIVERSRRIVPYLSFGFGTVMLSSSMVPDLDTTEMGITYGAGMRIGVLDRVRVRADVRGMRAGFGDTKEVEGEGAALFRGEIGATYLIWTGGIEISF